MNKTHLSKISTRQLKSSDGQSYYSAVKSVSDALRLDSLLIHYEELAPGNFSAKPHAHTTKDEVFIFTCGEGLLIASGKKQKVSKGDIVSFKGCDEEVHVIQNTSKSALCYISIATNPRDDRVNYKI